MMQRKAGVFAGLVLVVTVGAAPAAAQETTTITVDTTSNVVDFSGGQMVADLPGPDGQVSLREATIASTNTTGPETIAFNIPTSDPGFDGERFVINIDPASEDEQLTIGDAGTTLDATTQPGGFPITVVGSEQAIADSRRGLIITSSGNAVIGLGIRSYGLGVVTRGPDNLIDGVELSGNRTGAIFSGAPGAPATGTITGSSVSDNSGSGVVIINTTAVLVDGNTITRNAFSGVSMLGADEVTVTGNLLTDNGGNGIRFDTDSDDPALDAGTAEGNTITGNGAGGVVVGDADGFTITRNSIADNGQLGVNLLGGKEDEFGVTKNRKGGPNFPEKVRATDDGTVTTVEGRVDYADPQSVTIELFVSDAPDPSGFGEGTTFVATATPDGKGRFVATLPAGLAGQWMTATATGGGGTTSEFSEATQVATSNKKK